MNFAPVDLDQETLEFWRDVREFLDEHLTDEIRQEQRLHGDGMSRVLHLALGSRGWVMPAWPVEQGGAGLDAVRLTILQRELYARDYPYQVAGSNSLVLEPLRRFGSEELKADLLPRCTRGEAVCALGYTEPGAGSDAAAVQTRAIRDGEEWVVTGQKMFSTGAHLADYSMVLARSNPDAPKHKGLTMLVVPLKVPGVEIQAVETMGGERTNIVFFDEVRVPDSHRLGDPDGGWVVASAALGAEHFMGDRAKEVTIEREAPYTWAMRRVHDAALAWAQSHPSVEHDRAIDDPHVRRRLAEAALATEVAAASPALYGRNSSSIGLMERAGDLTDLIGAEALLLGEVHGRPPSAGLDPELVGEMYYFAPATAIYGGTVEIQRNLIAEKVLGLPRSTPREQPR